VRFLTTPLGGVYLVDVEKIEDERGFFARSFCQNEFKALGLDSSIAQCNMSFNRKRGTLRGLHYQASPHEESKLVRCSSGAIWDVIADLRSNSPTFGKWFSVELSASNRRALYVPSGFAHGFQTLADNSEVLYQMSTLYNSDSGRGIKWNDPYLSISWPLDVSAISPRDQSFPILTESGLLI
jgi:dTDP-4-dehydrorhamnose 3,5-epimerase